MFNSCFHSKTIFFLVYGVFLLSISGLIPGSISRRGRLPGVCTPELEAKFLSTDGKCQYSGLVPIRGSCTAFVPCVSIGGDFMKPMKRIECPTSAGWAFDIFKLKCTYGADSSRCLQRICFPEEAVLEDGIPLAPKKIKEKDQDEAANIAPTTTTPVTTPIINIHLYQDDDDEVNMKDAVITLNLEDSEFNYGGENETSLMANRSNSIPHYTFSTSASASPSLSLHLTCFFLYRGKQTLAIYCVGILLISIVFRRK